MSNALPPRRQQGNGGWTAMIAGAFFLVTAMTALHQAMSPAIVLAGDGPESKSRAALPPDLALVPPESLGFVQVRVSAIWETPFGKKMRRELGREMAIVEREVLKRLGVPMEKIKSATLFMQTLKDEQPVVIVNTLESVQSRQASRSRLARRSGASPQRRIVTIRARIRAERPST